MKKFFVCLMLLSSFSVFAADIEVKVNGMVCSMCAQGIQKKFSGHPEVKKIEVNLDKKVVNISTLDGKDLADETITKIITEAGYNVANIQRK
jgi:periplasmic mercuric ion binding protein